MKRPAAPSDPLFAALLFVVALAPRLGVALAWAGEPVWDGHYYDFGARRIAQGLGYSDDLTIAGRLVWHPWCHYPVGYSAFLALFYRVLGASHAVAGVADALCGAALAVVTWALARHAMSPARARVAGLIVALHPGLVLYAALVMTEPLASLLTLTAFWVAVRDSRPGRGLALGALVLGLAALVHPQALLCAPFLALVTTRRTPGDIAGRCPVQSSALRAIVLAAGVACALALVPVLPWTARNCRVMDGCALVSTNGGWNLAIGAFPRATGRFETLRSSDGCREVTGQVQQDRCWLRYGVDQIRAHPWHWLKLVPAKLGYTFDHESFEVEYLHEARPADWPEARREAGRNLTTLAHRLLLAAAVLGCIAWPGRRRRGAARDAMPGAAPGAVPGAVPGMAQGTARGAAAQGALLAVALGLVALAFAADAPTFWPLAIFASTVPWLPLPGRPAFTPALRLGVALLVTTVVTHAVFFGEDRYHVVVTPVLAMLAAAALRPSAGAPSPRARAAAAPAAAR